jgi:type IV secretion system protein VirD4
LYSLFPITSNDPQTAEYVSNRLGEETIIVESGGTSHDRTQQAGQYGNTSTSYSENTSHNWQQHGRKLLKPEEVVALDPRVAITFTPGVPPIWTWLVRYYEKGFGQPTGLSPGKMAFDTACLFLASAILAAMWTAGLFHNWFR